MDHNLLKAAKRVVSESIEGKKEIAGFAIATIHTDGTVGGLFFAPDSEQALLGSLSRLEHLVNVQIDKA